MSITYSECVSVALVTQLQMRMHHIATCGLPRSTEFFPTLSPKGHDLKKKIEHKVRVAIFSTNFI
jgi:predicted methyltransferase MtxX (methanogen marker protein 4)